MVEPGSARTQPLTRRGLAFALLVSGWWGATRADEAPKLGTLPAAAQDTRITLELIMSDPDWIGRSPENPFWADDGQAIYFEQKRSGEEHRDLVRLELDAGEPAVVADDARGRVDVPAGALSQDRRFKTYSRHGDIYVKDLRNGKLTQLTRTAEPEIEPFFMADADTASRVAFTRGDQVFVRDLESGLEFQAADLRLTKDPTDKPEKDDFLSQQQLRLFDHLRKNKHQSEQERELAKAEQSADTSRPPLPFFLGPKIEIRQRALSPAGNAMLLVVIDKKRDDGQPDQMPAWVTRSGYVTSREVRAKVGTDDGRSERLIYLDLKTHEQHEIDLSTLPGIQDDPLAELKRQTAEAKKQAKLEEAGDGQASEPTEAGEADEETTENAATEDEAAGDPDEESEPRAVRFEEPVAWSPDGRSLAVQAHSYDNKDRWLALVDLEDKTLRTVHHQQHEAWINWFYNDFGWLADGRRLYYLSEASGYSQLYLYSLDSDTTRRLTDGDYVVSELALAPRQEYFYYTANPEHPGIYEGYRVAITSGRIEQLTDLGGLNVSRLSPDGESLLITHSTITQPPELYLQPARPGAEARRLTHTISERFAALPWNEPDVVAVPSTHHSRPIYSRYYPPRNPALGPRPAVVFAHGAGYLQNAHHGWSGYFREFMFHTLLTDHGYAVLDMDYRASAGYGADWRTAIYRQMGFPELEDLADGVTWLVDEHSVDADRVGIYGGSYGGFLTMMALFKQPDLFACGAALRPVTDWAHYNHPYTANILNTPEVDPEAYLLSSPIELAEGLDAPLLICAPMQDDNVFFADTVRLAQRLIELEKQDWEVAIYPIEPHGFRRPSSWLDEYRRIFKLFETHLKP